jgi:hypothetical protein
MLATIALVMGFAVPVYGLHWSEVAIRGDHLDAVLPLFKQLKYKLVGKVQQVSAEKAWKLMEVDPPGTNRVRKAAYVVGGWTHIADPEMVLMVEYKVLARLSKSLRAPIVTWVSESTSDTFGFDYYDKGVLVREAFVSDGKVWSKGKRLAAEGKVVWKDVGEGEIMGIVKRLGPAFDGLPKGVSYRIYDLDE